MGIIDFPHLLPNSRFFGRPSPAPILTVLFKLCGRSSFFPKSSILRPLPLFPIFHTPRLTYFICPFCAYPTASARFPSLVANPLFALAILQLVSPNPGSQTFFRDLSRSLSKPIVKKPFLFFFCDRVHISALRRPPPPVALSFQGAHDRFRFPS